MNTDEISRQNRDDDIGVFEIFRFFQEAWRLLAITSVASLLLAGIYLLIFPPEYEASAPIEIAKVTDGSSNVPTKNVESPSIIIERLQHPTSYSEQVIRQCKLLEEKYPYKRITRVVTVSELKGADTVVIMSVRRPSPEIAKQCYVAVFDMFRQQQTDLSKPYYDDIRKNIAALKVRLKANRERLSESDNRNTQSLIYLSTRDEYIVLTEQIESLNLRLGFSETRLVAPVYTNENSVYPSRSSVFGLALVIGLSLGFAISLLRNMISRYRAITNIR